MVSPRDRNPVLVVGTISAEQAKWSPIQLPPKEELDEAALGWSFRHAHRRPQCRARIRRLSPRLGRQRGTDRRQSALLGLVAAALRWLPGRRVSALHLVDLAPGDDPHEPPRRLSLSADRRCPVHDRAAARVRAARSRRPTTSRHGGRPGTQPRHPVRGDAADPERPDTVDRWATRGGERRRQTIGRRDPDTLGRARPRARGVDTSDQHEFIPSRSSPERAIRVLGRHRRRPIFTWCRSTAAAVAG